MALCLILAQPHFPFGSEILDEWINGAGILIIFAGEAIRLLVAGYSQKGTSIRGRSFQASKLVTTGPYARMRHPLYLANFLIGLGICLIIGVAWVFLVYLAYFLIQYIPILVAEEKALSTQFKEEYEAYASRVPRFIPKLIKVNPAPIHRHDTICGFTMAVLSIEILENIENVGFISSRKETFFLAILGSLFLLGWRFIKDRTKNRKVRLLKNYGWIFGLLGMSIFSFIFWGI
jgi:protein-S-isoprenylcysteine O-methyltransferase Ste14